MGKLFHSRLSPSLFPVALDDKNLFSGLFCFHFIPSRALVQRAKYIFGYDRKHAINRNNCPKSLRKLFVLIIIILCDNRFILLFSEMLKGLFLLCHKSDDSWQKFKKSVMMGQMIATWDKSRVCWLKKEKGNFPAEMKQKFCFFWIKKLGEFISLLNETFPSPSCNLISLTI